MKGLSVWLVWCTAVCMLAMSCTPTVEPQRPLPLGPDTARASQGRLLDAQGRELLLRGFNARVDGVFDVTFKDGRKKLQNIPPFTEADCRRIGVELGLNLLRLPINWSGIEPSRGVYNQAYLDKVFAVVKQCYKHGVYTLLDFHQDAYSKEIGEDGAPLWAILPKPDKLLEGPLTDLAARRTSGPVLAAFKSFFENKEGLQDAYAAMAAHVAKQAKSLPGVVGMELMNEPVLVGVDASLLDVFHEKIGKAIRKVAPSMPIYFEPNSLRNLVDTMPVEKKYPLANAVYSPHIYTQVFQDGWKSQDVAAIRGSVFNAQKEARKHGTHLFIGEFGNDPKLERGRRWLKEALALFDEVKASWAVWLYEEWSQGSWGLYDKSSDGKRGSLRQNFLQIIARPFPSRLAGRLKRLKWTPSRKELRVEFSEPLDVPHVLTAPTAIYPKGVSVTCGGEPVTALLKAARVEVFCKKSPLLLLPAS